MEFLVHVEITMAPGSVKPARHAELMVAETVRAAELAEAGIIRRLWRIPGRWASWGLYEAADATALHTAVASLPLFPWMDVSVHPLARHPNDPDSLALVSGAGA
jgi:muconolactone D-isomerase